MLLAAGDVDRLRTALTAAAYTVDDVDALLGPVAAAALGRGDPVPGLRASADGDALSTLTRLFLLGASVPAAAAQAALRPLPLAAALAAGLVEDVAGEVAAGLDLRPYADDEGGWWVLSDLGAELRPGPLAADHVLGIGGASVTLAQATVRPPVATALDVGTGCGVQALHLSRHARRVTATDRNPRALALAATTAAVNGLDWELLRGDLLEPVAGRRFDLVVSNPPFVAGPGTDDYAYRDSGLPGDELCRRLVAAAPAVLAEGGWCQLLANWLHVRGRPWQERVAEWLPALDAWVIQREVLDPPEYVEMWLRDAGEPPGPARQRQAARWLDWFAAEGVEAVGLGLVSLHAGGATAPVHRVEELTQPVDQPLGRAVIDWFGRQDWLRATDDEALAATPLVTHPDLRLDQRARPAPAEGWVVDTQVFRLVGGLRWTEPADPVLVALVAGCDGTLPLGDLLALLAAAHEVPVEALTRTALPAIRHLAERGMLRPALR